LLALRGQRINGLLQIAGSQVHGIPGHRYRVILQTKSAKEPFELEVPAELVGLLEGYIAAFNAWASANAKPDRIGAGVATPFWRSDRGAELSYQAWTSELKTACERAGVPVYSSHALRRAFATEGVTRAMRQTVAIAGGWTSTRRMDDHYTQPSLARVKGLLRSLTASNEDDSRLNSGIPVASGAPTS
jgi:integrase